jgi:hypothetical protein
LDDNANTLYLGTDGAYSLSKLDDVALWNRALSSSEITALCGSTDDFNITQGTLSGVLKDSAGSTINASTYNTKVNVYPKGNSTTAPIISATVTASNGVWAVQGIDLTVGTKYLVTFEFEGTYTPLSQTDIAGAEFVVAQ